ncbi:MAG: PAS domain-containing protein [Akkermansiaceae bacterium]
MSAESDADNRLELALKASNEGVWDWDIESDELFYSNRVLKFLGFGRYDAVNIFKEPQEYVHPEDFPEWERQMNLVCEGDEHLFAMEPRVRNTAGKWKWFRVRAVPRRNEEGKVTRLVGSMIDISKRKSAEAQLEEERARIDLLLESVPVNVYLKDRESRFLRVNRATAERMGVESVEALIGKTDHDFFGSEHADEARAMELRIMETRVGQIDKMEHEVWEDGHQSWALVTKMPWIGVDDSVKGTFGVTNDVTELVATQNYLAEISTELASANRAIEEEQHRIRLVIDNIPMFVYFKDVDSKFRLVNQGMAELVGTKKPSELVGKHDRDFFSPDMYQATEEDEKQIMATGEPLPTKLERIAWKDGHVTWSISSKFPWYDQNGKMVGTFGVSGDVTELVETRDQLAEISTFLARKNEAMAEELQLAREVQQAAIPKELPKLANERIRFDHRYEPASDLAGDFFEVMPLGTDKAGFLVCDVMGHGVRAALIVSMLRGLLEKGEEQRDMPGEFLQGLNAGLCHLLERTGITIFSTAIYGVVDLAGGTVKIASAGHPAPLVKGGGAVKALAFEKGSKGPALGLVEGVKYGETSLPLTEVEALWCFTDGVFEVQNAEGAELGPEGMAAQLERDGSLQGLIDYARNYSVDGKFDDDVCVLGLELG